MKNRQFDRVFVQFVLPQRKNSYIVTQNQFFTMNENQSLSAFMKEFFGYDTFKGDQEQIIRHVISGATPSS